MNIVTPCNGALVAWISVIQRDLLNGIIRVRIDGSQRGETTLDFSKSLGATRVGPGAGSSLDRLRVGLLSCTPGERPAEPTALYWKRDGKAIGLPGPLQAAQMPKAATHQ